MVPAFPFTCRPLYAYVLDEVKYSYTPHLTLWPRGVPESVYVHTHKYGDCGAQSMYFSALCRAVGVPARTTGVCQTFTGKPAGHFWAEFYLPNYGWLPVDPTAATPVDYLEDVSPVDKEAFRAFFFGSQDDLRLVVQKDTDLPLIPRADMRIALPLAIQTPAATCDGMTDNAGLVLGDHWTFKRADGRAARPPRRRPRTYTSGMMTDDRTLADLRAAELLMRLDGAQLLRLAEVAQPRRLGAEETLFLQGDAADAFYLLAEGRLKVFKLLRDGRSATIRHVEPGQTFAEAALFHNRYPAGTETLTECLVYRFDKERMLSLLLSEPCLAVNLLAAMAELLGLLNRRVEELLLPVPARLARYLLARADEQLEPAADGGVPAGGTGTAAGGRAAPSPDGPRVIRLPVSKRELAARLGTVPETLSRTFDRFKRAQVIRMSGDHHLIEILSFEQLHRLAQD